MYFQNIQAALIVNSFFRNKVKIKKKDLFNLLSIQDSAFKDIYIKNNQFSKINKFL